MNIKLLVQASFEAARSQPIEGASRGQLHSNRSRVWVETLADHFRHYFAGDLAVRVFSKYNTSNRKEFGVNELLYDILVCRVDTVESARHRKELFFIREVLWQIESEFARDSRQALVDFNKLVLGSGQNKLFVGPQVHDTGAFLNVLRPAASVCTGNVFASLIPHPRDWEAGGFVVEVWRFAGDQWVSLQETPGI